MVESRHASEMSCAPSSARQQDETDLRTNVERNGQSAGVANRDGRATDALGEDGRTGRPGDQHERQADGGARRHARRTDPDAAGRSGGDSASDRSGAVAARLIGAVGDERFARWFGTRDALMQEGGVLVVQVADKAAGALLEKRFGRELREAVTAELGGGALIEMRVRGRDHLGGGGGHVVEAGLLVDSGAAAIDASMPTARANGATRRVPTRAAQGDRYRLESFLVSASNRLAYNAAVQMAEGLAPVKGCSPLFVHGVCGVGKTHLLQGVAVRFRERHPGATVRVTSGEQFMNEFVNSVRSGSNGGVSGVERFRRAYRKVDLLCIDDVHFLASKQATQAELLHTFDEIERGGARIVLVSDEHPRRLSKFSPGLVSRFMAGMVAGVQAPDAELRGKIVQLFGAQRGLVFAEGAVDVIVERTAALGGTQGSSVREIEGLLVKVEAMHRLLGDEASRGATGEASAPARISASAVSRWLDGDESGAGDGGGVSLNGTPVIGAMGVGGPSGAMSMRTVLRPVRAETIVSHTCTALGVETSDLAGKTRHKRVVLARAVITHLARQLTTHSYPEIARIIGRPNHSTVITAFQRFAKQLEVDGPVEAPGAPEARTLTVLVRQIAAAAQAGRR